MYKPPRFCIELAPEDHIILHAKNFVVDGERRPKSRATYYIKVDKYGKLCIAKKLRNYG